MTILNAHEPIVCTSYVSFGQLNCNSSYRSYRPTHHFCLQIIGRRIFCLKSEPCKVDYIVTGYKNLIYHGHQKQKKIVARSKTVFHIESYILANKKNYLFGGRRLILCSRSTQYFNFFNPNYGLLRLIHLFSCN